MRDRALKLRRELEQLGEDRPHSPLTQYMKEQQSKVSDEPARCWFNDKGEFKTNYVPPEPVVISTTPSCYSIEDLQQAKAKLQLLK